MGSVESSSVAVVPGRHCCWLVGSEGTGVEDLDDTLVDERCSATTLEEDLLRFLEGNDNFVPGRSVNDIAVAMQRTRANKSTTTIGIYNDARLAEQGDKAEWGLTFDLGLEKPNSPSVWGALQVIMHEATL